MDRGNTTYNITNTTDDNSILSEVSVNAAGQLSYKVLADKTTGNTASITVTAAMDNYADTTFTVNISITDKIPVAVKTGSEVKVTGNAALTYGQSLSALTLNTSGLGKAVFVEQGTNTEVAGILAWTNDTTKPEATAEGNSYAAEWTFTPSDTSYEKLTGTVAITVKKAAGTVENQAGSTGYATNYTFTGGEIAAPVSTQFTTNSGSTGFTFTWYQGSVSETNKLADNTRPSAVGKYVLKVDVAENANYTAATKNVTVEIQKFTTDAAAALAATNAGSDGWYHGDVTIHAPAGYTISTTQSPLMGFAGSITVATDMNGSYPYYLKQDGTGYLTEAMTITVKKDTTAPTAGIQVKETWWQSFLETVTFGLYTNDMDTITIKAEDTAGAAHSGIGETEYYISSTAYVGDTGLTSLKALGDTVWTAYNSGSKPTVLQNQVSYVYVRVTDKAGNVNYVSTDGIVQDETAPTLTLTPSGTAYTDTSSNPNTYTGTVNVIVTASDAAVAEQDTLESVKYMLDQGTAQSVTSGGTISITGKGVHTLTVTAVDKAGNQTVKELTVRIYAEAPAISLAQNGTVIYDGTVIAEGTDFTLNRGGSTGTVSYRYKIQGTDDSTYVTGLPMNAGSYTVEAAVAEDGTNYYKAGTTNGNITIGKATPTITLGAAVSRGTGIQMVLTATVGKAGNGAVPTGNISFKDVTTGSTELGTVALANGSASYTYTGLTEKVYKLQLSYEGNENYNAVTTAQQSVDTAKQNQTALSINTIGAKTYGDTAFTLSTTGGSGTGAVTYVSSDSSILSITGNRATILKAGTVTITATKAADNDYNATTGAASITIAKKTLTITAQNQLNVIKGSAMPTFTYTSAGLVNGDTVTTVPTMNCSVADTNTLGEYVISISGAVVGNQDSYHLTYVNGKMTVVNQVYTVNVTNGTATVSGSAVTQASEGQVITLTAANRDDYTFKNWSSNAGGSFTNANAKTTTFTMPASDVTITANYTKNSSGNDSGDSGNGGSGDSGNNNNDNSNTTNPDNSQTQTPSAEAATTPTVPQQPQTNPVKPNVTQVEPTKDNAAEPFIEGAKGKKGWEAIASEITDTFTEALKNADVDVSAITDENGKIDLNKLAENPQILDSLSNLSTPLAVTVDMNGATELPADIISLIAGKNIDLTLEIADGISWTINGNSVTGTNFSNIDLDVTKNADKIPVDIVNQVSGDNYSMQIELSHNGEFGFTATLNINLEKANAGYYANLFYFNEETGELEFVGSSQIDKNGNAALDFVHASSYTIVVSEEPMSEDDLTASADSGDKEKGEEKTEAVSVSATQDAWNPIWIIVIAGIIIILGVGAVFVVKRKKEDIDE